MNKMDTLNSEMSQSYRPANKKRHISASPESNGTPSSSLILVSETPRRSITSADEAQLVKMKTCIGRFFYENELDFGAVNSPSFQRMVSLFFGQTKCQIPTPEELRGWIFDDVMKETRAYVNEIRSSWADTGCSILLDEWTDENGRNVVNVLADCPKGTVYICSSDVTYSIGSVDAMLLFFDKVIAEVGINNVVQIITNTNSAFTKEVGEQLMDKHRSIFWTVSASHCIELMMEKLKQMDLIKETLDKANVVSRFVLSHPTARSILQDQGNGSDLLKPSKIMSIRPFLALENIVLEKEILTKMFLSSDPNYAVLTSTTEGRKVARVVAGRSFWNEALIVLNAAIPLARVIEWINENEKEQMGYIYETIDQVKETIKHGFKHKKPQYTPFWKVIDDVWNELLYSPLHSAGYFLNPNFFYSPEVYIDPEVVTGLFCCFVRSTADTIVQDRLTIQLEKYRIALGAFRVGAVADVRSIISPAHWWAKYGGDCPDLQRLAARILSQTCDGAARFRLKRSWAEKLVTKAGDPAEQKQLADMLFVRYNMHLQNLGSRKTANVTSDEAGPSDNWIVDKSQTVQGFIDLDD